RKDRPHRSIPDVKNSPSCWAGISRDSSQLLGRRSVPPFPEINPDSSNHRQWMWTIRVCTTIHYRNSLLEASPRAQEPESSEKSVPGVSFLPSRWGFFNSSARGNTEVL